MAEAPLTIYKRLLQDATDRAYVKTSCKFCPKSHNGTAKQGREWAAKHRARYHPEAIATTKRRRRK